MNKLALQFFLVLSVIPLFIFIGGLNILLAPLYCAFLALNSYRYGNTRELYFWLSIGMVAFLLALFSLWVGVT